MNGRAVILAHAHDLGATAVRANLSARLGPQNVTVVRPEILGLGCWSHWIGPTAEVQTNLRLPSGVEITSPGVSCLFNRLQYLPSPRFVRAPPRDRDYAAAELQALVASWLHSLGPRVVNPVGPRGQAQGPNSRRGWLALAAACKLPVVRSMAATAGRLIYATPPDAHIQLREPWPGGVNGPIPVDVERRRPTDNEVEALLVAGDRVSGPLAAPFGAQCHEVARRSGCTLLEFRFGRFDGETAVFEIDPLPALTQAGAVSAAAALLLETAARCEPER